MLYAAAGAFLLPLSHDSAAASPTAAPLAVSPWRPGRDVSRLDRSPGRYGRTPVPCSLPTARFLFAAPLHLNFATKPKPPTYDYAAFRHTLANHACCARGTPDGR